MTDEQTTLPVPTCLHGNSWNNCTDCGTEKKKLPKTKLHVWLDLVAAHVGVKEKNDEPR